MDFITRDQLVAGMNAWVLEKEKPLGQILIEQKALREDLPFYAMRFIKGDSLKDAIARFHRNLTAENAEGLLRALRS